MSEISQTSKIAIVGDIDSVLVFRAFGAEVRVNAPDDFERARHTIDKLARDGCGVIFVTEQIASGIPETIAHYRRDASVAIVLIPSGAGSLGIGLKTIRENVEKAVGINVLD